MRKSLAIGALLGALAGCTGVWVVSRALSEVGSLNASDAIYGSSVGLFIGGGIAAVIRNVARPVKLLGVLKAIALALVIVLAVAGVSLAAILLIWPTDSYSLLDGRKPLLAGELPPREVDDFVNEGWHVAAREYRVYTWEGDFATICAKASIELPKHGFALAPDRPGYESSDWAKWNDNWIAKDGSVAIGSFRTKSRRDVFQTPRYGPGWVTVVVVSQSPQTLITFLRAYFEPQDY